MTSSSMWRGPKIQFAMCDNSALVKAGRAGAEGTWLFSRRDTFAAKRLPMRIGNAEEAEQAQQWIEQDLADAGAWEFLPAGSSSYERGEWRKASAPPPPAEVEPEGGRKEEL